MTTQQQISSEALKTIAAAMQGPRLSMDDYRQLKFCMAVPCSALAPVGQRRSFCSVPTTATTGR